MPPSLAQFLFQLAAILFAAKLGGEICQRYLKQSPVLGELAMGMIIGPYALGGLHIGSLGPLFPLVSGGGPSTPIPVSNELYSIAQLAIIVLLFSAGLGTDFQQFIRFAGPASLVAVGGAALSFALGALAAIPFDLARGFAGPTALFTGAIISATSVGMTARILRDIGKLSSAEGVTTLAADVIDDVIGILILTVVLGLTAGAFHTGAVLADLGKAIGFWLGLTAIGLLAAKLISRFITSFRVAGSAIALALALAFLAAGLAEEFGLATVIGAYSIGLALSDTRLAEVLTRPMDTIYHIFVPIFFVVMGMLVDFPVMGGSILLFGLAISLLAILGKLFGCGLPALGIGFNRYGALRIGFGMMPRGEVSLIIASIGLTRGLIPSELFGVAVMVIMVTTVVSPVVLTYVYKIGGGGRRE